jgi:hypothetical protein
MASYGDFTGNCGENSSAKADHPLQPNQTVRLNGNDDLSSCVKGNDDACAYGIELKGSPGIYDYVVELDAQGPSGLGSGSMYYAFKDESGDVYHLSVYSSSRSVHTVRYNSKKPAIVEFKWDNHSIDDW